MSRFMFLFDYELPDESDPAVVTAADRTFETFEKADEYSRKYEKSDYDGYQPDLVGQWKHDERRAYVDIYQFWGALNVWVRELWFDPYDSYSLYQYIVELPDGK